MKRAAILPLLAMTLAGCDLRAKAAAEAKHAEMERRMLEIEVRLEQLEAENRALRLELQRASAPADSSASIAAGPGPRCSGDVTGSSFTISRADADALLDDLSSIAVQMRIVPHFKDGKSTGFKLFAIRGGSFPASCGLRNGDILKSVNGHSFTTPDEALEAYTKTKTAKRAVIEVERTGAPFVLTIDVKD